MPQTRIEIEEIGPGRWVGEVEAGGVVARRRSLRATSLDEIILAVIDTHAELTPAPVPRPVAEVLADQAAVERSARIAVEAAADAADEAERARLRAEAAALVEVQAVEDSERAAGEAAERTRQDEAGAPVASTQRDALIAQAEGMGLAIDRRWGDARLRDVVEAEHARRAASA